MLNNPKNIERYLTKRYVLAISLVAILAISAYIVITATIEAQRSSAVIINISGRQRMLSQRIKAYAIKLIALENIDQEYTRRTLEQLADLMNNSHQAITQGNASLDLPSTMSETVRKMYFEPPIQLDQRVKEYVHLAKDILNLPSNEISESSPTLQKLISMGPGLLKDLDLMVKQYELEAKENVTFLHNLELLVLISILIVLALEVGIIFRPMVNRVLSLHSDIKRKEWNLVTFVKHTPAAIAMFDKKLNYIAASDLWNSYYGNSSAKTTSKNPITTLPKLFSKENEWEKLCDRVLKGEVVKVNEEKLVNEKNVESWVRYEMRPWKQPQGAIGGLVILIEDITSRKKIDAMKDELISTISHEFRTPLTSVQMSLGLLKNNFSKKADKEQVKLCDMAHSNCQKLSHLLDNISNIEKTALGEMDYQIETVEMTSFIKNIIEQWKATMETSKVEYDLKINLEETYCKIDKDLFQQALINILSNADKFSPENDVVGITIQQKSKNILEICVSDNGPGIPVLFKDRIFGKFSQADSSSTRNTEGMGLGLNIAKNIIEAFKGKITYKSQKNKGTDFYLTLPIVKHNKGSSKV